MSGAGYGPGWYADPGYRRRLEEQLRAAREGLRRPAPGHPDDGAAAARLYPTRLPATFDRDAVVTAVRAGDETRRLRYGVDVAAGETAYVLVAGLRPVGLLVGDVVVPVVDDPEERA